MGGVVLDTNTIVRAILSPAGARRKLWLLLVYGGAVERARLVRHEHQAARAAGASNTGTLETAVGTADAAAAHIAGLLPPGAPSDRWAIASPPLLAEYHRKLHDLRDKLAKPPWTAAQIDVAYRALVAGCGDITPDFEVDKVPHYTDGRDRDDDAIIHTALMGGAELLISNDTKDISLDRDGETEYGDGEGRTVRAMTFEHFATTTLHVDLDTIDGSRLAEAYATHRGSA
ncbi:MAG: hypothetical protein WD399_05170 [Thermoleophilaceae bacterium]